MLKKIRYFQAVVRCGRPIHRNYCVFWKLDDETDYIQEFGEILKSQFHDE